MKIFAAKDVRGIDEYTIKNEPIASLDLMERAAATCSEWIVDNYSNSREVKVFIGPGNNGGDGLVVARKLSLAGYNVEVYLLRITNKLSEDAQKNYERLKEMKLVPLNDINNEQDFPQLSQDNIVIDALFGSGLSRPLKDLPAALVKHINNAKAKVVAVDIPSGLFGEDNSGNDFDAIIVADHTITFQFPSLSFFFSDTAYFVGKWKVTDIGLHPDKINQTHTPYYYIEDKDIQRRLKIRYQFDHKGVFGHALLIAGSYGKMGAAVLAAKAGLRSGVGLLTTHIPKSGYSIMQTAVPEAMLSIDWSDIIFTHLEEYDAYTAIGIGPGLGQKNNTKKGIRELLENTSCPLVIDADGLNNISAEKDMLQLLPSNTILTPHPKEFERLAGKSKNSYEQLEMARSFARKYHVIIVLKGAYTRVINPEGDVWINSTGNPGMATAGSGDVLTGMLLSLLGQGYKPFDAAITGVYLHGLAGDLALEETSQEALIAGDIVENIGNAYLALRNLK